MTVVLWQPDPIPDWVHSRDFSSYLQLFLGQVPRQLDEQPGAGGKLQQHHRLQPHKALSGRPHSKNDLFCVILLGQSWWIWHCKKVDRNLSYTSQVLRKVVKIPAFSWHTVEKNLQCMSIAYRQKLTSPKWNRFLGMKLRWKDKIRLNNVIWRCWHMQFIKVIIFDCAHSSSPSSLASSSSSRSSSSS